MNIISVHRLAYDKDRKRFSVEASELGMPPGTVWRAIVVRNPRTGRMVRYTLDAEYRSKQEPIEWRYSCDRVDAPLIVFND